MFGKIFSKFALSYIMKKSLVIIVLFFLINSFIVFSFVKAESETKSGELSVELDIPEYIPDAESLRHPETFFSGDRIVLKGEFGYASTLKALLINKKTGEKSELTDLGPGENGIRAMIPVELDSGDYQVKVVADGRELSIEIRVKGLSEQERKVLQQGGGGAVEEKLLSGAILYTSKIDCDRCYWESVLTGHPTDSRTLVFQGGIGTHSHSGARISNDGGRSWRFIPIPYSDPDVLVPGNGKLFISGNYDEPAPPNWPDPSVLYVTVDANDDGVVDISDAITTLNYLFNGNPKELKAPFKEFGTDPTSDNLKC